MKDYFLPPELDFWLLKYIGDCSNGMISSASSPSTPDIIVTGQRRPPHYKHQYPPFGLVAVIQRFEGQRTTYAKSHSQVPSSVSPGELGVLIGFSSNVPGDFLFYTESGQILSRKVMNPVHVVPFILHHLVCSLIV